MALMAVGFVIGGTATNSLAGAFVGVVVGGLAPVALAGLAKAENAAKGAAIAFAIVLVIFGGCTMALWGAWHGMGGTEAGGVVLLVFGSCLAML